MAFSESRALYGVRFGSPEVLVVKADPEVWELAPYFSGEGGGDPARQARSVREWAEEIPGAALVVNGGQYYADGTSMGKLSRGGAEIESRRHPGWKGFLSSGPAEGRKARPFAVADEELPRTGEEPGAWLNVLQSYMALDRLGRVRVKSSASLASRTAVGEDADGRICIVYVPGAATLYDLALILGDLEIFPAVSLDGGFESQMALRRGGGWLFYQGEYSHNALGNVFVRLYQPKLRLAAALVPAGGPGPAEPRAARMPGAEALPGEAPVLRGAPRAEDARKPEGPEPEREREPERDGAARTGR
ncbi:MAG: phosphodiester glycosidase family protein [Deltaproteobacteria bacterium]|nr:phosphodiester glycosidase family protein [Deltaproteobacteria bacterium]